MRISDWSSDVCSSDLAEDGVDQQQPVIADIIAAHGETVARQIAAVGQVDAPGVDQRRALVGGESGDAALLAAAADGARRVEFEASCPGPGIAERQEAVDGQLAVVRCPAILPTTRKRVGWGKSGYVRGG